MMEHGYSMMTVIDYPIDQFGDMIESITKEYGGKIELSPFDEDMGDKHGNYYSRDDEDFGITTLYYKLKDDLDLYDMKLADYAKTRFERTPLQGSVAFEIGTLLGDRWQPTQERVAEFRLIYAQLEKLVESSEYNFTDCFRLRSEKESGWKLLMAQEAVDMLPDVEKWFAEGRIMSTMDMQHTLYTESMWQRFAEDNDAMELLRQKKKFTVFGLGFVQDGSAADCALALKNAAIGIVQKIEVAAKADKPNRKRNAGAATRSQDSGKSKIDWPKNFDIGKIQVNLSNIKGTDRSGNKTHTTMGWIIMPDEFYSGLPLTRFIAQVQGYRSASIKPYKSKEMREQDKMEKMSSKNLNTWKKAGSLDFRRAAVVGSTASVQSGSSDFFSSSSQPAVNGQNVEQTVDSTLEAVQELRQRLMEVESSAVKKASVKSLVQGEFTTLAKKFTSIIESFQKEMNRIQKQLDECVTYTADMEEHFKNRKMSSEKEKELRKKYTDLNFTPEMIQVLLEQNAQLVTELAGEDAAKVSELKDKLKVGQQNLKEVRAVTETHIRQMNEAANPDGTQRQLDASMEQEGGNKRQRTDQEVQKEMGD